MTSAGARPEGIVDEGGAALAVRDMFDAIAPRYDLLNHLLSSNVDRLWWWRAARRFETVLADPNAAVVDVCCGTGDMTMALLKRRPKGARKILAVDFARNMLSRGARKFAHRGAVAIEADALHLPVRSESVDLVTTAFGFRNLANYEAGLREFHRVLKSGGQLGILEFSEPGGLLGKAYAVYFRRVLPAIGRVICGPVSSEIAGPYNYLPESVGSFPPPPQMLDLLRSTGYAQCAWQPYTFGIAGLYTAARTQVS
jgi:demethylmenaquinone methyltransferase / 2-methoxy-6-polyprenyl-1,4-benzoquinol methylase